MVTLLVAVGLAFAVGLVVGRVTSRWPIASFDELDRGVALALGTTAQDVRTMPGYFRQPRNGCSGITCRHRHVEVTTPVDDPSVGLARQQRVHDAGWQPVAGQGECLSDDAEITGLLCAYTRSGVTLRVQVEPAADDQQLRVFADAG